MATLDQVEDVRDSLRRGGGPFEQCPECGRSGWTKATLLASMTAIDWACGRCGLSKLGERP